MRRVIRTVLFDLGGTLWYPVSATLREQAVIEAGKRASQVLQGWGFNSIPDPTYLAKAIEAASMEVVPQVLPSNQMVADGFEAFATVLEQFSLRLSPAACVLLRSAFSAGMATERILFSDVLATLEALHKRGLHLGVVSDQVWGEGSRLEIERSGLSQFFQSIVLSCEVGWLKPHERIFKAALSELKTKPEETVMVGDNLVADIQGAQALGIFAVWKRQPGVRVSPDIHPDRIIDQIGELLDLIPPLQTGVDEAGQAEWRNPY